ncbi:Chaperone DnaJ-domain superfamily protein [Striga hermonthica]|uniref:Chaperone DnaJ-domain superfamily protein n=1 Tax=Striga hermonthica TaxID=68872 RepID=A0A9N7RIU2_STRHE|nr:Chaperone DnaJ-domain superfamily protein [Striga hermonthica]
MQGTLGLTPTHSLLTQPSRRRAMSVRATVTEMVPPAAACGKSLYEVLRVRRDASQVEIRAAYRALAKVYHPDAISRFMDSDSPAAASSDGRDFIEIHNAYTTLSDPDTRAVYDLKLAVDSQRRWSATGVRGYRRRFYSTRRWETDQCW